MQIKSNRHFSDASKINSSQMMLIYKRYEKPCSELGHPRCSNCYKANAGNFFINS